MEIQLNLNGLRRIKEREDSGKRRRIRLDTGKEDHSDWRLRRRQVRDHFPILGRVRGQTKNYTDRRCEKSLQNGGCARLWPSGEAQEAKTGHLGYSRRHSFLIDEPELFAWCRRSSHSVRD